MLKVKFLNDEHEPVDLLASRLSIGRHEMNDVRINGEGIANFHVDLYNSGGKIFAVDLGSEKGTRINGERIIKRHELKHADFIELDSVALEIIDPGAMKPKPMAATQIAPAVSEWGLVIESPPLSGQSFAILGSAVIGREPGCDICIPDDSISRKHVVISVNEDGGLAVKDLGSTNGTVINGKKVSEGVVKNGDNILLHKIVIRVIGPEQTPSETQNKTMLAPAIEELINPEVESAANPEIGDKAVGKETPVEESINPEIKSAAESEIGNEVVRKETPVEESINPKIESAAEPEICDEIVRKEVANETGTKKSNKSPELKEAKDEKPADHAPIKKPTSDSKDDDKAKAPRAERAWWEKKEEGPVGTMIAPALKDEPGMGDLAMPSVNVGSPSLVGISKEYRDSVFVLGEGKTTIGRAKGNDIVLDHETVSARHAQIVNDGGSWKLINLLSSNGTFVNGNKIQVSYLASGDRIRFGQIDVLFVLGGAGNRRPGHKMGNAPPNSYTGKKSSSKWKYISLGAAIFLAILVFLLVYKYS